MNLQRRLGTEAYDGFGMDEKKTGKPEPPTPVRAVIRAVDLLFALTAGPSRLGDLAKRTSLSKATAYRLLLSLRATGLVMQDRATGDYNLGPASFRLVTNLLQGKGNFLPYARPILTQLRDDTGETVTIHVRVGTGRMCVEEMPSRRPLRYVEGVGETTPIHVGSAGKVLLAFLPEVQREEILASFRLVAMTNSTVTDVDQLRKELVEVARRGTAVSYGERISGAVGVSAPILDQQGRADAVLSVVGPVDRLGKAAIKRTDILVREAAQAVANRMFAGESAEG